MTKMRDLPRSQELFAHAQNVMPGGVNSPARAFKSVGGTPPFITRAQGCYMWDADNHRYIDYIGSWGPMILGHAHPAVLGAMREQLELGTSYGTPTEAEIEMAELVIEAVPSIEMVRMVNSGTEAAMSAIRLARGYTGRDKIIKFEGCYHGHSDMLLAEAGSGIATLGIPGTPGVPASLVANTLTVPFNDLAAVAAVFERCPEEIAVVALEPVVGNMGLVLPKPGFLEGLRELCTRYGALLMFDEVMTGFRLAYGGAQQRLGVMPDLTCLGKIIGGGLPVGAYGGRKEIMQHVAPAGGVYQAGTLSGNPMAMQAGAMTLRTLRDQPGAYQALEEKGLLLASSLTELVTKHSIPATINVIGSMFGIFFTDQPVTDFTSAKRSDVAAFRTFYHSLLSQGIYFPPSQFESCFISLAHSDSVLEQTVQAFDQALKEVATTHFA